MQKKFVLLAWKNWLQIMILNEIFYLALWLDGLQLKSWKLNVPYFYDTLLRNLKWKFIWWLFSYWTNYLKCMGEYIITCSIFCTTHCDVSKTIKQV